MRVVIIANGEMEDYEWHKGIVATADKIICADGGSNHAYAMGVTPHTIIGDLDSIEKHVLQHFSTVEVLKYPKEKDFTDTQLAINLALKLNPREIILLGALGKRLDHTLANIFQLTAYIKSNIIFKIIDSFQELWLMGPGTIEINGFEGEVISLIPITSEVRGITTKGLKYPLKDNNFFRTNPYGISNEMTDDKAIISQEMGIMLIIRNRQAN